MADEDRASGRLRYLGCGTVWPGLPARRRWIATFRKHPAGSPEYNAAQESAEEHRAPHCGRREGQLCLRRCARRWEGTREGCWWRCKARFCRPGAHRGGELGGSWAATRRRLRGLTFDGPSWGALLGSCLPTRQAPRQRAQANEWLRGARGTGPGALGPPPHPAAAPAHTLARGRAAAISLRYLVLWPLQVGCV